MRKYTRRLMTVRQFGQCVGGLALSSVLPSFSVASCGAGEEDLIRIGDLTVGLNEAGHSLYGFLLRKCGPFQEIPQQVVDDMTGRVVSGMRVTAIPNLDPATGFCFEVKLLSGGKEVWINTAWHLYPTDGVQVGQIYRVFRTEHPFDGELTTAALFPSDEAIIAAETNWALSG